MLAFVRFGAERQRQVAIAVDEGVAGVGVETESGVVVALRLHGQAQRARLDCSGSYGSEQGTTNSEPAVRWQDEEVFDLPKVREP